MKIILRTTLMLAACAAAALAQQWEFGGSGGGSFLKNVTATGPNGSAKVGFDHGFAASAYVGGFSQYKHIGGELRYTFLMSDLMIKDGSTKSTFSGNSHLVHYDLIIRSAQANRKWQVFGAAGAGMRLFRGTGTPAPYIPLTDKWGAFTRTQQVTWLVSGGGGIKVQIAPKLYFRGEVRGYISPFPKDVIAPPVGVKYGSWLLDIVPMAGISVEM
jgi:hypothetical protein